MKPSRLFWKFFLAFWLATCCSFIIGAGLIRAIKTNPGILAGAEAVAITRGLIEQGGPEAAQLLLQQQRGATGALALYDAQGRYVAGNPRIALDRLADRVRAPNGKIYRLVNSGPRVNGAMPLLIGGVVSVFFSAALAWYFSVPLAHLSQGFRAVSAGRLGTRVRPQIGARRDEIADLAREFDGMAAQLEELWLAQQRLLHNVSHELRSPLARLQVAIGLLRQSFDGSPDMLGRVEREAERLEGLIGEVLTLARLKDAHALASPEKLDLMDLIVAIVEDANFEARPKGCHVRLDGMAPFVTLAEGELLYRAFENVIRNAVKYSPQKGDVVVTVRSWSDRLLVEVDDEGPGVPEASRVEIFDAFKRLAHGDEAADGFGLGLAIAREAVERHGGSVRAEGRDGGVGLRMVIEVPRRVAAP